MNCSNTPIVGMRQKVFQLSDDANLAVLLIQKTCGKIEIHVKITDEISGQFLCLTEDLLLEIIRESRKFGKINIEYPCTNVVKRVHVREECGAYLIKYQRKKIVLTQMALLEVEYQLPEILKALQCIEMIQINN